jgi:type I restriction enzyme S subunit
MSEPSLPLNWSSVRLGSFVVANKGKKPTNLSAVKSLECPHPYVDIEMFEKGRIKGWTDGKNCRFCCDEDFLMVWDGSRSGLVGKGVTGALGSTLVSLRFPGIFNPYAFYFLKSKYQEINTRARGTGTPHVDPELLWSYEFLIPPYQEQKRIVGKIEALFSELDAGVANLKQARAQLAVYRQALLKHAFEGHLTAIKGIKKVPLSSLITDLSQGWSPKCELNRAPKPDEWAVIKTTAIQHCRYDDTEAKPLPPPFEGRSSIEIKDGDFLMTRKGPRTRAGVSCYVRRTRNRLMVCDTVYRFRCIEDKVTPLYLELALNSPDVLRAIDQRKAGISESGLSLTHSKIGTVEIPLCSLDEQQDIVRQLDEQTSVMDALEADIDLNLQKAEALRQSILKKAFAGELVPQDPADEPAAALLARIRTEREAQAVNRRARR